MITDEQIENTFTYHKPLSTQPARYEKIRNKAKELAYVLKECGMDSRELSVAFTNLQQCVMWANASIAINEVPPKCNCGPNEACSECPTK